MMSQERKKNEFEKREGHGWMGLEVTFKTQHPSLDERIREEITTLSFCWERGVFRLVSTCIK